MNQKGDTSVNLKSILLMPVNIVTVIGMIFFIGQLSLPASLYSVVSSFASITTPLSMFLVGLSLSRGKILEVFKDREVFTIALMRLILIPLAAVAIMRLLPWRNDSLLVGVAVLIMAMPCPSLGLVFAQQYHEDTALASKATFFTSFACMITIPLILLFVS